MCTILDISIIKLFEFSSTIDLTTILPNVNSSVGRPEAERAVITAEGPGIGNTDIPLHMHDLACVKLPYNYQQQN